MAEHTLKLIIEAIDRAQGTFNAVEGRIRGLEASTRATGASLAGTLNGIQQGFNQLGGAASTGIHAITSGLDPLKGTLDTINAGVSAIQQNISRVSSSFGGLVAAIPIVAGIGAAAEFMSKSLRDAGKETQNFIALQATWNAQSRGTEQELGSLIEQVKTLSRTSSYASQDVVASMKFLAGFPAVATKDLLPALQTAIDFAAYQNIGIQEATRVLSFAATGRTEWLEHFYGFNFTSATKESKDFSKILGEMQARVSGQEAAKMQTYAGAVGMLEKSFNRVEKAIGHVLEAAIVPVLKDLVGYFSEFGKSVEKAFESGGTEKWEERLRGVFKRVADYTKGVFDGIRNFAAEGGFDRLFTALENVMSVMQTLIGAAGRLLSWLVMLPKEVLVFIGAALGLTAVIKIVRMIWGQWQALWQTLSSGKARVADYVTNAVSALTRERAAVDATTAAYQRRNAAAAGPSATGGSLRTAADRQAAINASGLGYAGRTGLPNTPPIVPSGDGGGKWSVSGPIAAAAITGATTYAATGDVGSSVESAAGMGVMTLVFSNLDKLKSVAVRAGEAMLGFFRGITAGTTSLRSLVSLIPGAIRGIGTLIAGIAASPVGIFLTLAAGAVAWVKVIGTDIPNAWKAARIAAEVTAEKTGESQRKMQRMVQEGYQPKETIDKISKKSIEGKTTEELKDLRGEQMKDLEYQAEKYQQLVMQKGVDDAQVVAERKKLGILKDNLQTLREAQQVKAPKLEKPPETVNLLEDVKAIREKNKLIMELAKSEFQEKKTFLQLELAERKAIIAETIGSTILGQQAILRAEQENTAKRMQLILQNYEETKRIQTEGYNEERERIEKDLQNSDPKQREKAVKDLAKLDREHAKQEVDTAQQVTQELEKELQKQYELRAQTLKKISALEQQARDAQRATAQSIRGVNEAAASEYDRLAMKLEDAQKTLALAADQMPKFPEKALQLAKEAQGAFAGLAQNIDSLEQNIRNSQQLVADALRSIEQSRLTGVAKWRAEMNNLQTDMQRAQQLASEGRYKEAEAAYKRVIQQAQGLASSAPAGTKEPAKQQTSAVVTQAGKELLALQKKQLTEAKDLNDTAIKGVADAGKIVTSVIDQQIEAAKANIKALEENTEVLKKLIGESKDTESAARGRAGDRIKEMSEPQVVPKQGEGQTGSSGPMSPAAASAAAAQAVMEDPLNKALTETGKSLEKASKDLDTHTQPIAASKTAALDVAPGFPGEDIWAKLFGEDKAKSSAKSGISKNLDFMDAVLKNAEKAVAEQSATVDAARPSKTTKESVGELFSEPIKDMKGFAEMLREVGQVFLKAKEADSNINITVNQDGSVSMYRGGGQYDTFGA